MRIQKKMVTRMLGCRLHRALLVEGRGEQGAKESGRLKILD
jgi:hypothetical protein